jgi:uncharacterized phiE125 gp8 family phage protein
VQVAPSYTAHDQHLAMLLDAAREQFEADCGVVCNNSTWQVKLDEWWEADDGLQLSQRPITSIDSISYIDSNGSSQTWSSSNYTLDRGRASPTIWYAYDVTTPTIRNQVNAITVTYLAGYADAASVPVRWKQAILLLAGFWFEQRTPVVLGTIATEVPLTYERIVQGIMRSTYP